MHLLHSDRCLDVWCCPRGKVYLDSRSLARSALNSQGAFQLADPLAHSQEAQSAPHRCISGDIDVKTFAIIADADMEMVVSAPQHDTAASGVGVPRDIRQRFLNDSRTPTNTSRPSRATRDRRATQDVVDRTGRGLTAMRRPRSTAGRPATLAHPQIGRSVAER